MVFNSAALWNVLDYLLWLSWGATYHILTLPFSLNPCPTLIFTFFLNQGKNFSKLHTHKQTKQTLKGEFIQLCLFYLKSHLNLLHSFSRCPLEYKAFFLDWTSDLISFFFWYFDHQWTAFLSFIVSVSLCISFSLAYKNVQIAPMLKRSLQTPTCLFELSLWLPLLLLPIFSNRYSCSSLPICHLKFISSLTLMWQHLLPLNTHSVRGQNFTQCTSFMDSGLYAMHQFHGTPPGLECRGSHPPLLHSLPSSIKWLF